MSLTGTRGKCAENLALKFLRKQGLALLERNFHCRYGELDLVLKQGDTLVFVEVRYRKNQDFGGALESIDRFKQAKLRRAAEFYLLQHKHTDTPCRFDILCLAGSLSRPDYDWIQNAF